MFVYNYKYTLIWMEHCTSMQRIPPPPNLLVNHEIIMCLIKRSWACSDQFAYNLRKDVPASISKLKIA